MSFPTPSRDPFYGPVDERAEPGTVLRARRVELSLDIDATCWQVVYRSTGSLFQPITVSGTVLVPTAAWAGSGPRPVLSYGVGVHGLGRDAAPSYLMRIGREPETRLMSLVLAGGWAVAVTDGEGLGLPGPHTYGAGRSGGHAMLDIVRAASRLNAGITLDAPALIWGYSEGGRYAAWAAELAPAYAPELDLRAVAAGGVPADLRAVARAIDGGPFSALGLAVLIGLARAHQDPRLLDVLDDRGRVAAARAATCDVRDLLAGHPQPMRGHTGRDEPWDEPAWRRLLEAERAGRRRPQAPVYLYHVPADEIVPVAVARDLHTAYQVLGAEVSWADVAAADHLAGAVAGAGPALGWLSARLPVPAEGVR
jgi:hypothetical protein